VETPAEIADELGIPAHTEEWLADDTSNPGVAAHAHGGRARVVVVVDRAVRTPESPQGQTATVYVDGKRRYRWDVSTGRTKMEVARSGKRYLTKTPVGFFRPTRLHRLWRSRVWEAEMRWAIFFVDGVAFHAAAPSQLREIGRRASGGCVRLRPANARTLFQLVASSATGRPVPHVDRDGTELPTVSRRGWDTLVIVEDSSVPARHG
jgi:lipoprotein-anchoring transpeptidase ErfK/SrfK